MIYLDNAATTRPRREVVDAILPFLNENYSNAYSIHSFGVEVRESIESARRDVAKFLNCSPDEIYFTSGAAESNNWVIYNTDKMSFWGDHVHIITTPIEHDSILNALSNTLFCKKTFLKVDKDGIIDLDELESLLASENEAKVLVSIMTANNEIGTIQPIEEIGKLCSKYHAMFHTDATQALSTMSVDVRKNNIDMLSFSSHKLYGPKGVGVLYIKNGLKFYPMIFGGEQENNMRAGTTNSPGIVGTGVAIRYLQDHGDEVKKIRELRDRFVYRVLNEIPDCSINGTMANRVCGNANICFHGIHGAETLLLLLDNDGIIASSGSACNSSSLDPSHVLKAIGMSDEDAKNSIRFSFGIWNTMLDVDKTIESLKKNLIILRSK